MRLKHLIVTLLACLAISCESFKIPSYDQIAYQKTIEIKVESDYLLDNSAETYSVYEKDVEQLKKQVAFILEYEKNRPNNQISYSMWQLISDKNKNLLIGYFELWKKNNKLSKEFSSEVKKQMNEVFSLLLKYEAAKTKENKAKLLEIINSNK